HTRWPRDWSSDVCSSDLPGLLSSKMNVDSLCDWAYFYLLSCSFSFYDVCLLLSDDESPFTLLFPARRNPRSPGGTRGFGVRQNGSGKLAGRTDDGAAGSSPAADSLVVTRQPFAPSYEG